VKLPAPDELRSLLHERGWRLTPQRELILEAIREADEHIAPEAIYQSVSRPSEAINRSTVYRTLEMLEGLGLLRHAHLDEGETRYQRALDTAHVYFICLSCGAIQEAPAEPIKAALNEALGGIGLGGFRVDPTHHAVAGTCAECRATHRHNHGTHRHAPANV
jgi:Fur family ferric uptake transcriptional regulator